MDCEAAERVLRGGDTTMFMTWRTVCVNASRAFALHAYAVMQDWLRTNRPDVYEQTQYTCVEISTRLAAQQYESVVTKVGCSKTEGEGGHLGATVAAVFSGMRLILVGGRVRVCIVLL